MTGSQIVYFPVDEQYVVSRFGVFFGRNDATAETPVLWPSFLRGCFHGAGADPGDPHAQGKGKPHG